MRRLLALLLACALLCMAGCASISDSDATQGASTQGGDNVQPESIVSVPDQTSPGDKAGKDNRESLPNGSQNTTSDALRVRATADECNRTIDIAAILPRFGVFDNGSLDYGTRYAALLCQCATVSGETLWLYISTEDYTAFFDPEANAGNCRFAYSDIASYSQPIRVNCAEVPADSLSQGLADQVGENVLLFGEAHSSSTNEVVAVMYTDELPHMTCVYIDAMAIEPVFLLANGCAEENTDVICRVTALDGSTAWIAMTIEEYTTWIDPNANLLDSDQAAPEQVTYQIPLRLYGVAVDAEVIAGGLSYSIGCTTAVCFVAVKQD